MGSADSDCYYLVNCANGCSILRIKDWINDPSYGKAIFGKTTFMVNNDHEI